MQGYLNKQIILMIWDKLTEAGSLFYRELQDVNYNLLHDPVNIYECIEFQYYRTLY